MNIKVRIPTPLRKFTNGESEVQVSGNNIAALIDDLDSNYNGIKEKLCDETGNPRKFLNIYLNDEDIRFMDNLSTELRDGDTVALVPAIAGGICSI